MYELSKKLIEKLKEKNVKYCHWKSNLFLNEALAGYDDLDLLVDKKDIDSFEIAILSMGFKEGSNKNISFSSIKHFYGYDKSSGNILHLHVYYQIKTGPSWTKSMRFDFEEYLLDNLIIHESGMPVPDKHIEFTMFIFRIMLKYSKLNELILVNKEHQRTLKEIEYLMLDMDEKKLEIFLELYFENISKEDIFSYVSIIQNSSNLKRYISGKKVKNKLSKYSYTGFVQENINNVTQFLYRVINKLFLKQKKKLHTSGILIVVAGLDATGKTTITTELKKWLGKNLTTKMIHFGKPSSTFLTYPFNILIKLVRKNSDNINLKSSIKTDDKAKSFLYIARQLILAYDRYNLAKKSWNKVSNGEIVICDRYKSEDYGVMDSKRLNPSLYTGLKLKLAQLENNFYNKMPKPNVLFYLNVPVEIAVVRNKERIKEGKESEEFIRIRHEQNQGLKYKAKNNYLIDTNKDYADVIKDIKTKIWDII